jgi:transcriptional regulator with XRE-family HTH domain
MPAHKLPNYLRTHRKRVGFSQEELTFLLGGKDRRKISQYELALALPSLKTALAYEVIFGTPIRELFAGVYEQIEREVVQQAEELAQKIYTDNPDQVTARKLEHLRIIIFGSNVIAENE